MFKIYKDLTNKGTEYTVYDDEGTWTYLAGDPELEEIAVAKLGKDWESKVLVADFRESINEALLPKSIELMKKWIAEMGDYRKVAIKLVDSALNKMIGMSASDISDSSIYADGLDSIEEALKTSDFDGAWTIAKETARDMVSDEDGFGSLMDSKKNDEAMQEAQNALFGGISGGTSYPTVELNGRTSTETTPEEKSDINKIGETVKEAFENFAKKYNCKDVKIDMTVNYKKDSIDESKEEIKKLAIECVEFGMHSEAVKLLEKIKTFKEIHSLGVKGKKRIQALVKKYKNQGITDIIDITDRIEDEVAGESWYAYENAWSDVQRYVMDIYDKI